MLIDDITITVQAGKGGNGAVSFRKEKFIPRGGPDGGNGGWGGSVHVLGVNDITALRPFRYKKEVAAQNGEHGRGKKQHGARGADTTIPIPVGSLLTDTLTGDVWEINNAGDTFTIARGGRGGRGNWEFKSSTEKAPGFAEEGRPGKSRTIHINLQFIADVGLIGLPSAGKSSLLNALTNTDVKVADYPFTTLEPHLGMMENTVLADIPGLIEGAHSGKGLGVKFLKHIEKTSLLLHCIDGTIDDVVAAYHTIRNELAAYNPKLAEKEEIIVLTKSDMLSDEEIAKKRKELASLGKKVLVTSIVDDVSLRELKKTITA